jgi:5-formyltetrahydrofolate cyclo-ligase
MTKSEWRKIYLKKQAAFDSEEQASRSKSISDCFFQSFEITNIGFLHCFLPIKKNNEIDTFLILEKIWQELPRIATLAPWVDFETDELGHIAFSKDSKLIENKWGIPEPTEGARVAPEKIDLVIVPLLCFDERGYRVGYGKGFYDRFLAECRPDTLKVGLSYFPPVKEISDIDEFDVRLNACVTPEKVWQF